jgi:type IV pilus assembly protein PilA
MTDRNRRPAFTRSEAGFTLIELLVVILIIGILAGIAIPSFLNQRYKGQDACAKSMAKQMYTAARTYHVDNSTYNGMTIGALQRLERAITGTTAGGNCQPLAIGNAMLANGTCNATTPTTTTNFCVSARSLSRNTFVLVQAGTALTRRCNIPAGGNKGGCRGVVGSGTGGSW